MVPTPDGESTQLIPYWNGQPVNGWVPQDGSQVAFLECSVYEALFTGTRGGGKSEALLADYAKNVGRGYGEAWKGIIFRQTYDALKDIIDKSMLMFKKVWGDRVVFTGNPKPRWTWATGEQLLFRHMDDPRDYDRLYHGHEYPWMGWEELTTWATPECYLRMISCCRSSKLPRNVPRKLRSTTNPYGAGFHWVKDRFGLPFPPGKIITPVMVDPKTGHRRVAIHSDLRENRVLLHADPEYVSRLKASARNEAELKAWLEGSWDIASGGMFDDIWYRVMDQVVVKPFRIPPTWRIDRSFDWGSSRPFVMLWWAQSDGSDLVFPDGRVMRTVPRDLFLVKEWYGWNGEPNKGLRMLASDIARGAVERELRWGIEGRVRRGVADASIFDEVNGNCVATDMERAVTLDGRTYHGVYFDPADKRSGTRISGWQAIRERLSNVVPEHGRPRERPGLFVTTECRHFLRTVPSLPRDPDNPDDVDTESEDHVGDAVRYRVKTADRSMSTGRVTY